MKKLLVLSILFLAVNINASDFFRVTFQGGTHLVNSGGGSHYPPSNVVIDFNNITFYNTNANGTFYRSQYQYSGTWRHYITLNVNTGDFTLYQQVNYSGPYYASVIIYYGNVSSGYTGQSEVVGYSSSYDNGPDTTDTISINYRGTTFPEYSNGNASEFGEHDRIYTGVQFIDINSNGLVDKTDLYEMGASSFNYPSSIVYFSDLDGDDLVDSGELFEDDQGVTSVSLTSENIPIRYNLNDTDGDGVDEGDEEDEEEDEFDIDEKFPKLAEFKELIGLDSLSIPTGKDITFTFQLGSYNINYGGISQTPYLETARLGIKSLFTLLMTFMFIKALVTTFRQW